MREFILDDNLSEVTFAHSLALDGTVDEVTSPSETAAIYWRWEDDPEMDLQYLGETKLGTRLQVPFENPDRRAIRFFPVGFTQHRNRSVQQVKQAKQTVFYPPESPTLISAVFSDPDVDLEFTGNGGGGDIYIQRKIDTGDFAVIATAAFDAIAYTDTPSIDGDYTYKLTQENVSGESNEITVSVNVSTPGTGTPPDTLAGVFDGVESVPLTWVNHGGTGDVIVERRINLNGTWTPIISLTSADTTYTDPALPGPINVSRYYRVRNESVAGYSNELFVFIPKAT